MKVEPISKAIADQFVLAKHYSRRAPIFWAGFGLIEDGMVTGVVVYGQPSPPIQKHAFRDRDFRLYELSRLSYPVIDSYPKCDQNRYDDGEVLRIVHDSQPCLF